MASIDDLKVSFLNMSESERFNLVRNLREARRTKPESPRVFAKSTKGTRSADTSIKKTKSTKDIDLNILLKTMSSSERAKLAKELGLT